MRKTLLLMCLVAYLFISCTNTSTKTNETEKEKKYLIIKGMNKSEAGNYEEALSDFFKALEMEKDNLTILRNIALTYSKLGNSEKGKEYFRKSLKIEPSDYDSLYNLSVIYYQEGSYEKAIETLSNVKIENVDIKVIKARAYNYYKMEEYKKSYIEFNKLLVKNEIFDLGFYNAYIDVLNKINRSEEVYSFVYKLYSMNKNNFSFVKLFSDYLKTVYAYKEAIEILKEYGIEKGFQKDLLLEIAEVYYILDDNIESEKYLNLISQEDKYSKDVIDLKIKIYKKVGKEKEAKELEKVLNMINKGE